MIELDPLTFGAEQRCFGCGPHHQAGLRMRFFLDGDQVVTRFVASADQEGPPGIMHGGLQATLADELAAWTLIGLRGQMGFTSGLELRLLRPARIGVELTGSGRIRTEKGGLAVIDTVFKQNGKTTMMGKVVYALLTVEQVERTLGMPMPEAWRRFAVRKDA